MDKDDVSVFEAFRCRCDEFPDRPLYTTVDDAGQDRRHLTAAQAHAEIEATAGYIAQCGLRRGDRAVLVYTPSMEFVTAFLGCLRAGVVPVPVAPPDPSGRDSDENVRRFSALCGAVGARAVLANREYIRWRMLGQALHPFRRRRANWPPLPWHTTDGVAAHAHPAPPLVEPAADDAAFIQYTSGATDDPKGVVVTYGNLRHQLASNAQALGLGADTRAVFWVPHFHDLCLISGILSAWSGNGHLYLVSPLAFVRRPAVWFEVMSRVQATHTAAPNLAFELAVRKTTVEQRLRWDLSSLRVLMSAAEPIRHSTVRSFYDAFFCTGLRDESFCPAYGLAEHSVGVSVGGRQVLRVERAPLESEGVVRVAGDGAAVVETTVLYGCGRPMRGVTVRIVDPETRTALPDASVGEIWVKSASVAAGYVELAEGMGEAFGARLEGDAGGEAYLRTGDLGFILRGEVFFVARMQDVVSLPDRRLYPQDVEETVRDAHPLVRPGCVVACAVDEGGRPALAVLAEVRSDRGAGAMLGAIAEAIRRRVLEEHGEPCVRVWLGEPGSLPKTTSGKLMRARCRERLAGGGELPGTLHVADLAARAANTRRRPAETRVGAWPR